MSNVVHFPRHLAAPSARPLGLPEYMERKYERMFNEPWAALETRVRERHPDFFELYDSMKDVPTPVRQSWWWRLLKWRRGSDE